MFCRRCDGAYHCYCQHPPHKVGVNCLYLNFYILVNVASSNFTCGWCRMLVLDHICAQSIQGVTAVGLMFQEMDLVSGNDC